MLVYCLGVPVYHLTCSHAHGIECLYVDVADVTADTTAENYALPYLYERLYIESVGLLVLPDERYRLVGRRTVKVNHLAK